MNYFIEEAFKDKAHWKKIFIGISVLIAFFELIIESVSGVGFFGGYFYKGVFILGTISLVITALKGTKEKKDEKKIPFEQNLFEGRMRAEFKNIIRENPAFQTFCYECVNYNNDKRSCSISFDVRNKRALKTSINNSKFEYCLYWKTNSA